MRIKLNRTDGIFTNDKYGIAWCLDAIAEFWCIPGDGPVWLVVESHSCKQSYRVLSITDPLYPNNPNCNDLFLSGHEPTDWSNEAVRIANKFIEKHRKCYVSLEVKS